MSSVCKTAILCSVRFVSIWTVAFLFILANALIGVVMASATRIQIPIKTVLAGLAGTVAAATTYGLSRSDVRELIRYIFTGPGSYSRIAALLVILVNCKNIPFVWHYRVLNAIFGHMEFPNTPHFSPLLLSQVPAGIPHGPSALFQPVVTTSYAPFSECDYNLHKSNSTYFSDLDVTRSHLVTSLLRQGIRSLVKNPGQVLMPDGSKAKGKWFIMLGSVHCSFKREIGMMEGYEMWSRILCWDRKWFFIVTHFVKKGAVDPDGYTLDDGSWKSRLFGARNKKGKGKIDLGPDREGKMHKAVFASAVSKYCMKLGRFTIHPEVTMNASGLLPARPGGWNVMDGKKPEDAPAVNGNSNSHASAQDEGGEWDWKRIEAENRRGMKFAEHFAALDGLHEEFTGEDRPAIGKYRDLLW